MATLIKKKKLKARRGGTHLKSQHLGGRDRHISEFEASLVYKVSSRTARFIKRNPVSKKQTNKQTKIENAKTHKN
jgi:mRNA-degrading endonuclease YafQ of YafQ-DinJ toxin-antitoxin module